MRPDIDQWGLSMALLVADRSTCARRHVGAVLLNRRGHVLATGYNGVYAGAPHCNEGHPCNGASAKSGEALDQCQAIHAEQNALLQCRDVYDIYTCYVTVAPCVHCTKLLLNTSTERIVFLAPYAHTESEALWRSAGRMWQQRLI